MLYLSSSSVKKEKISEVLQVCGAYGINNIELSGGTKYYAEVMDDLRRWKETNNFQYAFHAYFPPPEQDFVVNLASCNDMIYQRSMQHYFECIDKMAALDCHVLSLHAGFLVEVDAEHIGREIEANVIYDKKEAVERFCDAYERIAKKAAEKQITLYLENNVLDEGNYTRFQKNNYFLMTDYESIKELKDVLNFNLLLDLGHLHVSCHTLGLNYFEEITKLKKYVKWIHLSENNGLLDQHKILTLDSSVYKAFLELVQPETDVTLEVKGELEEVISNYNWVKTLLPD